MMSPGAAPELASRRNVFFLGLFNRMLKGLVRRGSLTVIDAEGVAHAYGDGGPPVAVVRLHDPALYAALFFNPEMKAGEAYMDGTLTIEEGGLTCLLEVFHINALNLRSRPIRRAAMAALRRARRLQQYNPLPRARANVAHHYDLSNDFYQLFLDKGLNYSCAYFERPDQGLEDAQRAKLRHIAAKLRIEPGMRVLDIGSGWGSMALYLAETTGAEVLGVTLSREQHRLACERAEARGLANRVSFRVADYRETEGRFDRIVSVGMFEHVGVPHYDAFFGKLGNLLADDGLALIHAIGRKGPPDVTGPWIRKYIFPGGYCPALSEVSAAIEREGLWALDVEILRLHYAETLKEWAWRFKARRDDARAMFDERFCRMWEFYLATSEFAFRKGGHMVFQVQLGKTPEAAPLTRDYMRKAEKALRQKDCV